MTAFNKVVLPFVLLSLLMVMGTMAQFGDTFTKLEYHLSAQENRSMEDCFFGESRFNEPTTATTNTATTITAASSNYATSPQFCKDMVYLSTPQSLLRIPAGMTCIQAVIYRMKWCLLQHDAKKDYTRVFQCTTARENPYVPCHGCLPKLCDPLEKERQQESKTPRQECRTKLYNCNKEALQNRGTYTEDCIELKKRFYGPPQLEDCAFPKNFHDTFRILRQIIFTAIPLPPPFDDPEIPPPEMVFMCNAEKWIGDN